MMPAVNHARPGGRAQHEYDSDHSRGAVPCGLPVQASLTTEERGLDRVEGERRQAALAALLLALLLPACAAQPASSRFIIRSGHGPIDAGHLPVASKSQRQNMERASREALAK